MKSGMAGRHRSQHGATLIITMLLLMIVLLLGIAAAQIALQGEKSSRNDRDHQIAFQAAEAALLDAEMDIQQSPDEVRSRSHLFGVNSALSFPVAADRICARGDQNIGLGLCRYEEGASSAWRHVDFMDTGAHTASSVTYGKFTGQSFQSGMGLLPARLPRYIIELIPHRRAGTSAEQVEYLYRITAVGFGVRETTQVALQTFYRKAH